jgi:hypothetical protein
MTPRRNLSTISRLAATLAAAIACLCALVPSALARSTPVAITGQARVVPGNGTTLNQVGSFSGAPFGSGSLRLRTRIGQGQGATFTFSLTTKRGSVSGSGTIALEFGKTTVSYHGTASITSGTGAYRSYRARNLRVTGNGALTAEKYPISLTGSLTT